LFEHGGIMITDRSAALKPPRRNALKMVELS
jgi:hypothetical protein